MGGAQMQNPPRGVPGLQRGGQPSPQRSGPQPQMRQAPQGPQGMSPLAALALMALMQQQQGTQQPVRDPRMMGPGGGVR